jgi:ribosomal protein L12E/L44/L45/RPP1/RPP2
MSRPSSSSSVPRQPDALPANLYLDNLSPGQKPIYRATSADVDLSSEIRLMRTVLALLEKNIEENLASIVQLMNALIRAVTVQARTRTAADRDQPWLSRAQEEALQRLQQADQEAAQ